MPPARSARFCIVAGKIALARGNTAEARRELPRVVHRRPAIGHERERAEDAAREAVETCGEAEEGLGCRYGAHLPSDGDTEHTAELDVRIAVGLAIVGLDGEAGFGDAGGQDDLAPADPRRALTISAHKAFVRGIPLTPSELRRYRAVFAPLDFVQTWTPFEQAANSGRAEALALIDGMLATRSHAAPVPLASLGT